MPEADFAQLAESLRRLLEADAVVYWRQDTESLAVPLGVAPAGVIDGGFLVPAFPDGVCLLRGQAARSCVPLRMRARLDGEGCAVLAGGQLGLGGILATWYGAERQPGEGAEAAMEFAVATLRPQLELADVRYEIQRSAARRMSGLADALPLGVIVVPAGNRPGYVNGMAAALLDLAHGTVDASHLSSRLGELAKRARNPDEIGSQLEAFLAGHGGVPLSGQVWRFPGTPSALRVTVAPIDPEQAAGWFWLLEDVSAAEAEAEAREHQRQLEWRNAELEHRVGERTAQLEHANEILLNANMELEHFAHAIAHDLQTPLRSIAGFAQLMQQAVKRYKNAEIDHWSAQVINNAQRLQTLIRGLLSYTRLDTHATRAEPVDMNKVYDEVVSSLQAMIVETRARVSRGQLPVVPCIRAQIGQVLQNLIENGLKYNTAVPPRVFVSSHRQGEEWVFAVMDNGMGIAPKYHRQIFDIFKRLHAYAQIPGTGIGLALCRRIIERHGGRIWVESLPGEGSSFYFTLPAEETCLQAAE